MNDEVKSCLKEDGSLFSLGWYLSWTVGRNVACLDGDFTSSDLRSIADHMDETNGKLNDT